MVLIFLHFFYYFSLYVIFALFNCCLQCLSFLVCISSIPHLSMQDYCNIIMVHKLFNITKLLRASHCATRIFMGFVGAKLKGRPGQPTL